MDPSSPEDLEFLECQNEMLDNLLETHRNVERIISSNLVKNPNGTFNEDYLCKWQGLPYSDSTWEDGDLIKKRFPILIEEYEKRQNLTTLPPINVIGVMLAIVTPPSRDWNL
jgi:chromodomain-helicase-DNA-binding protein 1